MDQKEFNKSLDNMFDELKKMAGDVFPNGEKIEEIEIDENDD